MILILRFSYDAVEMPSRWAFSASVTFPWGSKASATVIRVLCISLLERFGQHLLSLPELL
jgi:hypothetical protein